MLENRKRVSARGELVFSKHRKFPFIYARFVRAARWRILLSRKGLEKPRHKPLYYQKKDLSNIKGKPLKKMYEK